MPVNESKTRSDKQWATWRSSGAVGSMPDQPITTLTSWTQIEGKFNIMINSDPDDSRKELIANNHDLLRAFYNAWFDVAAGKGRERLTSLTEQYTEDGSPDYNPELIDSLSPFITAIRESFPNIASRKR